MAEFKSSQVNPIAKNIITSLGNSPQEIYTQNAADFTPLKIKEVYVGDPGLNNKKPIKVWPPSQNIIICQYALLWESVVIMRITNVETRDPSLLESASGITATHIIEPGGNQVHLNTGASVVGNTIRVEPVPSLQGSYVNDTLNIIKAYNNKDREAMLSFTSSSDITFTIPDERDAYTNSLDITIPNIDGLKTYITYESNKSYTHVLLVTIASSQLSNWLHRTAVVTSEYKSSKFGWIPLNVNNMQQGYFQSGSFRSVVTNLKLEKIYKLSASGGSVTSPAGLSVGSTYNGRFMFMVSTDGTNFRFVNDNYRYISSTGSNVLSSKICTDGVLYASLQPVKPPSEEYADSGIVVTFIQ